MKHEAMLEMSKTELDDYGRVIGVDVSGKKTVAQKVEAIESRRERSADIDVLGMTVTIPIKRLHDKRVTDLFSGGLDDAKANELLGLILGDEQLVRLVEHLTDDDGTVDVEALGYAFATICTSDKLKNF